MQDNIKEIINAYTSNDNLAINDDFRLKIITNLKEILNNFALFELNGFTRIEDYYNYDISFNKNIEHFKSTTYDTKDLGAFAIYSLIEKIKTLNEILFGDIFDITEQIAYLKETDLILDIEEGFNYITQFIVDFKKKQEQTLPFLIAKKYRIFFSGYSYDDIKSLSPDNVINLINKLNNPLATQDNIPTSEGIDHVNSHYGTSYLRIRLGHDYRIAFERYHGMTIILGVAQKTGKNEDYNRYDSVARKSNAIHREADYFAQDIYSEDYIRIIDLLNGYYQKYLEHKNNVNKENGTTLKWFFFYFFFLFNLLDRQFFLL